MITAAIIATVVFSAAYWSAYYIRKKHPRPAYIFRYPWLATLTILLCVLSFAVLCQPETGVSAAIAMLLGAFAAWDLGQSHTFAKALYDIEQYANWQYVPSEERNRAQPIQRDDDDPGQGNLV